MKMCPSDLVTTAPWALCFREKCPGLMTVSKEPISHNAASLVLFRVVQTTSPSIGDSTLGSLLQERTSYLRAGLQDQPQRL